MSLEVSAKSRALQGKGASRRLRSAGTVPGILYGGGVPAQSIELGHQALSQQMRNESFHASILTMDLDGQKQQVLLRDVQMHPWRQQIVHVDFQRVAQDQEVTMRVPLHYVNQEQAQAAVLELPHGVLVEVRPAVARPSQAQRRRSSHRSYRGRSS